MLSIKVELAGLTEEVSSLQTRGPQPGLRGGGSRHHSSGGVGSKTPQRPAAPLGEEPINSVFIIQMQCCVCIFTTLLSGEYSFVPPHPRCPS